MPADPERSDEERSGAARHHRRTGPARLDGPSPSFWKDLWANPREVLLVSLGVLVGILWGGAAINDGSALHRVAGVCAVAAAGLLLASYCLRYLPTLMSDERWSATRPRRTARLVLRWTWIVFLVLAVLAAIVSLFL